MDPESVAFQPRDDLWRVHNEMLRVQQSQAELSDRVSRLEQKQENDSRLKNVWGTSSPFPSVLGGTPQQVPLQQPHAEHFSNFDDQSNLIGNLQLDDVEEPRRMGATSRANSVRFDETANHGHWAHASRSSLDLIPRAGSGLGGHAMSERSYSHKSDGRQSSAGHSVHSVNSGRANSLTGLGPTLPIEPPGLAPGLFILGSVPAIIRCWLDTNFKHNNLLYAAICTGSLTSYLDMNLVEQLGFHEDIVEGDDGVRKVKLSLYLPEAVPISASSRSNSPAPQLPSVAVDFTIVHEYDTAKNPKAVQIFLGSDILRAHNADVLFSTNQMTLYDDDRIKLQIPLVRPEDERSFRPLAITTRPLQHAKTPVAEAQKVKTNDESLSLTAAEEPATMYKSNGASSIGRLDEREHVEIGDTEQQRPLLRLSNSLRADNTDSHAASPTTTASRSGASPGIWNNWRRETAEKIPPAQLDWANVGRTTSSSTAARPRDAGIKVLRPTKSMSRTLSTSGASPSTGQSRFFDEGKKRDEGEYDLSGLHPQAKRSVSGEKTKENTFSAAKSRTANPVGGASAFAWLNSGGMKRPSFTTASTKKRKVVTGQTEEALRDEGIHHTALNEAAAAAGGVAVASPRSSPHPSSTTRASTSPPPPQPPPRYIPPHLHDEVLPEADAWSPSRDYAGASSPSEAYANLTLEGDGSMTDSERATQSTNPEQGGPQQRRAPRSSSPAKRLHSDMADDNMDTDTPATARRNSGQASPRPAKPASVGTSSTSQRSARASSVEMADAPNHSGSSETDVSNAGSSATSVDVGQQSDLPSIDEQVTKVMVMMQSPLQERQEGYVISEKWLERVWARTSENSTKPQEFSKEATQGPIGPIDNSGLVDVDALQDDLMDQRGEDFIPLNRGALMHQDFEILPTKAWELVVNWYGLKEGTPVIRRYAQNTVPDRTSENILYEVHPPVLTIRKVRKASRTGTERARPAEKIVASRYECFVSFLEAAKKAASIDLNNKVRVWRLLNTATPDVPQPTQTSGMLTPEASPRGGSPATSTPSQLPSLVMDVGSFNALAYGTERELVTGKDEKANEDFNESLTLDGAGLTQDQVIVLEEHDENGEYISDASPDTSRNKPSTHADKAPIAIESGRVTPKGPLTRGKTRNGKVRGHVGLTNLGNTCYMNSALQCLRSVEELSMYFLSNKWKEEVNVDNPIGHKGAIARVYAGLLNAIYDVNGISSFSPKNFKQTLGKANSLFSGYGQQDSQEFVSWLVDALHEDLNRVRQKPYRENPDSEDNTHRDPEAIKQLGETYRDNHKARNNSVAMDLFSGFYKNTMVCPECDKVSITFDPYSQLTLQLPIEQTWSHTITYVPAHGKPYRMEIDIDKNASIKALKEYVGKRNGNVPAARIMASEVYSNKFYKHLDDKAAISESNIVAKDDIWFYELDSAPSNWPPPKKKSQKFKLLLSHGSSDEDIPDSESPLHDRILVPVFNRGPNLSNYRTQQNLSMVLWPFFLVLTREEAKDYDTILRKILSKVVQMTTRPILNELADEHSMDRSHSGSDVVLTTEDDASPGDPRVHDRSVEGEDLIEVTMTDPADAPVEQLFDQKTIPDILKPGSTIPEACRHLFEMKHTRRGGEIVTTGWSTLDHSRALEPISKRISTPPSRAVSTQSSADGSDGSSSDEDAETPQSLDVDADAAIEAATVSSDEEMQSIEPQNPTFARGGRQKKSKNKKMRKQERKHRNNKNFKGKKNRVPEQPSYSPDEADDGTDTGLIRMGEAIVLDWTTESYDALFGGSLTDHTRGQDTMKFIETRADPEIEAKKARRSARRKNGITLDECFTESSKSEILSEDNAWYCSRCKELRRATKTLEIWTVPDILIIHLKRFSGFRSFRDKVDEFVDFPVHGLDLSGKVGFPEDKDLTYDLFAVDNHYGGLGGGHYTATAQNFFDKQWYDYNDSMVSKSSGERAVTRNAYLLFYRRRTPHPLGPTSLQHLVQSAESDPSPESEDDDTEQDRTSRPLETGNGQRLDASSRNGSSSAFIGTGAAAGAAVLRGGGSQLFQAGRTAEVGAGTENLTDDEGLPPYAGGHDQDEGFVDAEYSGPSTELFGPYGIHDGPAWSFEGIASSNIARPENSDGDSDMPALGSAGGEDQGTRILQDFGDELHDTHPGISTPVEGIQPLLGGERGDGDVHEIRVHGPD